MSLARRDSMSIASDEAHLPPHRREVSDQLFKAFDLDGNGAVSLAELNQVLEACAQRRKEGKEGAPVDSHLQRQRVKWMTAVKSQIRQAREQVKRKQSSASFSLKATAGSHSNLGQIHFLGNVATGDGDPSLDPDAFAEFIRVFSGKYNEDEFAMFANELRASVEVAYENTFGSKKKKLIWELFQLVDVNHDQVLDMKELQLLLHCESKKDKKAVAKWKAILAQRQHDNKRGGEDAQPGTGSTIPGRVVSFVKGQKALSSSATSATAGDSPNTAARKKSFFASGADGILTIQDEDIQGGSDEEEEDENPPLSLKDFQDFLNDFYGDDVERIESTAKAVRAAILEQNRKYLQEMKVDEIVNDILQDLLTERPSDVLDGIIRSVRRLQRTGTFPSKVYRSWSVVGHPFGGNEESQL